MIRLILIALLIPVFCTADKIKIGISTPLSGDEATFGEDVRDAATFANKFLADDKYELIFEDDKCGGTDAVNAATKFVNIDKTKAAILVCSGAVLSSARVYQKGKTVAIASYASSPEISKAGDYIFRTWPSDASGANLLADYSAKSFKKVGVLSTETQYCLDFQNAFTAAAKEKGIEVLVDSTHPKTTDFRSSLLRFTASKIDALFINTNNEADFLNILKQAIENQMDIPILGAYWPGSPTFAKEAPPEANGIVYVDSPPLDSSLGKKGAEIYKQYVAEHGEPNSSPFLFATTFEAFRAIHLGIKSGKPLNKFLAKKKFKGIIGPYSFDQNGDVVGIELKLYRFKDGKGEAVD